jgi:NAD(P)-dependent dehydrogenase (short-subunit alcohol dehydrogenase family)
VVVGGASGIGATCRAFAREERIAVVDINGRAPGDIAAARRPASARTADVTDQYPVAAMAEENREATSAGGRTTGHSCDRSVPPVDARALGRPRRHQLRHVAGTRVLMTMIEDGGGVVVACRRSNCAYRR